MSEKRWIEAYLRPLVTAPGAAGLQDDVATLSPASIITTDTLVEGAHFLPDDPIETIAWKLVRVNLSDIISKGGYPVEATLNLCWPRDRKETEFALFCEALGKALNDGNVSLIGGDTVFHAGPLSLSMTMTGRVYSQTGAPVRRTGAQSRDNIYVTGQIGWGFAGLEDRKAGRTSSSADKFLIPSVPSDEIARWIAAHATASMDISDGLLIDLQALLSASGTGAILTLDLVPFCRACSSIDDVFALATGGDDYQCLFTASKEATVDVPPGVSLIGEIIEPQELRLVFQGKPVALPDRLGYDHD